MEFTPRMRKNAQTAYEAALASMVLLKNVSQTLPLAGTVAVFGMGQVETALHCAEFTPYHTVNVLDGLCACDAVRVDSLLAHKYRTAKLEKKALPWESLSMEELAGENDAALVVITRTEDEYDTKVSADELALIKAVSKAFEKVVLVINAPGYMEVASAAKLCGAVVFMGIPGQEGGAALADLLTGRRNFRGQLSQSWPVRRADFTKANTKKDIYCGYRWFDSAGVDLQYDFGYGLHYGASELTAVSVAVDDKDVVVNAEVTNTSESWAVSRAVQVYVSRPASRLPQPKQVFMAFARTGELAPGESQTLTVRFAVSSMACFSEDASAFVLEAGTYLVRVGFSARSTVVAGAMSLAREQVTAPVMPLDMARTDIRKAGPAFTYPGEAEEETLARNRAIRLAAWNVGKTALRRSRTPQACRPGEFTPTVTDVKLGAASVYELVAALSDKDLRKLVLEFGFCPTAVPGALGASADLREPYGIRPLTVAAGAEGLLLQRDIRDEETDKVIAHQYTTAFPAASLLACAWDTDVVTAVGRAVREEMKEYGVDLWLMPGADVLQGPGQRHAARCWSEEPLLCGLFAAAMAKAVPGAVLRAVSLDRNTEVSRRAYEEVYSRGFCIAAPYAKALLIPSERVNEAHCGEDTAQTRALFDSWRFGGMILADDERYSREPDRLMLEQSALRILRFMTGK